MEKMLVPGEILRRIQAHAEENKRIVRAKMDWKPPENKDFRPFADILCFDQTLSSCGWALLSTSKTGEPSVRDCGTIQPIPVNGSKGFSGTFAKSVGLAIEIRDVLDTCNGMFEQVVMELPAVVGYRTESSLVAASVICVTLSERHHDMPVFVSRQSAGAVLCGDRLASKNQSSEVVNALVGDRHPTGKGKWTEHVRDAVFVGLRNLRGDA